MKRFENFKAGFISENPIFGLYLGLCSTLAISTTLNNAIGMGVAVTLVLVMSNVIISCIRKITPDEIRIPVYIVVIAALVKIVQMLVEAYTPELNTALGIFLPLIVVNCIILGRAEAFASKNGVIDSLVDGLGMGLGYTLGLLAMSVVRQIISTGTLSFTNPFNTNFIIFETTFFPSEYVVSIFSQPIGAFFTFACLAAALTAFKNSKNKKPWKIGGGIVAIVLVAFIALRSDFMVDTAAAQTPVEEENNSSSGGSETGMDFNTEITSTTENSDGSVTYTVNVDGYAVYNHADGKPNVIEVTVLDGTVQNVVVVEANDTQHVGDQIANEDFTSQFAGMTLDTLEVEPLSGATISSTSVQKAVQAALEAAQEPAGEENGNSTGGMDFNTEITNTTENSDGSVTYTVSVDGYAVYNHADGKPNVIEVTVLDGTVQNVVVVEANDTQHVGDQIANEDFTSQFAGMTLDTLEVEPLSGATISSNSAYHAVLAALEQ